ncbi:MAG: hypothetical protein PHW34_08460 [Hespellia sp.]|nr:hypothetical protein [Hespellia sp.]
MEIVIIYIWTMLVTSAIGIMGKYKGSIFVPMYIKILLFLPIRKGEKVAIYLIIIHTVMQLLTITCIICLNFDLVMMNYSEIQTLYGLAMGGVSIMATILCSWVFKKK